MPYPTTPVTRARPNQGGTINFRGQTINYAPSPGQNTDPNRAGSGGTITYGGVTRAYAPTPGIAPRVATPAAGPSPAALDYLRTGTEPVMPTVAPRPIAPAAPALPTPATRAPYNPPQQTERANPLSGDNNYPMEGQTAAIPSQYQRPSFTGGIQRERIAPSFGATPRENIADPFSAQPREQIAPPFIQRGGSLPVGQDARTSANRFARRFGDQRQQSAYDSYLQRLGIN
jgi:hypothetical protein